MKRSVGGLMSSTAFATLMGERPYKSHANFHSLSAEQQRDAIRRMARENFTDHGIACATGLAVEAVRRLLAPQAESAGSCSVADSGDDGHVGEVS